MQAVLSARAYNDGEGGLHGNDEEHYSWKTGTAQTYMRLQRGTGARREGDVTTRCTEPGTKINMPQSTLLTISSWAVVSVHTARDRGQELEASISDSKGGQKQRNSWARRMASSSGGALYVPLNRHTTTSVVDEGGCSLSRPEAS